MSKDTDRFYVRDVVIELVRQRVGLNAALALQQRLDGRYSSRSIRREARFVNAKVLRVVNDVLAQSN